VFSGACDASAGAALDANYFAAADDESNHVRVYSLARGGAPVFDLALDQFLRVERREPEADIEGAARIGDTIYWIGSHARNQKGKMRPSRQRLFATKIISLEPPRLEPAGRAYDGLLTDLEDAPELQKYDFEAAAELAPKDKSALNIEGLCAGPEGSLLIGFRNPVPKKRALLVPILNPAELVSGSGARARFGQPIRLDLGGRGVRDIVQRENDYFIVAGAYDSGNKFELYHWDGHAGLSVLHRWKKHSINPEAILAMPGTNDLLVLTDESGKDDAGRECKELPAWSRHFRGVLIEQEGAENQAAR
jgi:hypothetical protein